jgi:hypothetical protein
MQNISSKTIIRIFLSSLFICIADYHSIAPIGLLAIIFLFSSESNWQAALIGIGQIALVVSFFLDFPELKKGLQILGISILALGMSALVLSANSLGLTFITALPFYICCIYYFLLPVFKKY